jgi:hypothetical protein
MNMMYGPVLSVVSSIHWGLGTYPLVDKRGTYIG